DAAHCADLIARLEMRAALRQLRSDVAVSNEWGGGGVGYRDAARWALLPLVPRPIKRAVRPLLASSVPKWIDRSFPKRLDLPGRLGAAGRRAGRFPTAAQRAIAASLDDGWMVWERELLDRFSAKFSVESRFPFHDRRIVEFALAVPEAQRWRGDQTKVVLRQACAALMPASIRARRTKADFSYLFTDML